MWPWHSVSLNTTHKNHYLLHLGMQASKTGISPRVAFGFQCEELMSVIKMLCAASNRGIDSAKLFDEVVDTYLRGLDFLVVMLEVVGKRLRRADTDTQTHTHTHTLRKPSSHPHPGHPKPTPPGSKKTMNLLRVGTCDKRGLCMGPGIHTSNLKLFQLGAASFFKMPGNDKG